MKNYKNNLPTWNCKDCGNEWFGKFGNFCSLCGKPSDSQQIKPIEFDLGPLPVINGKLVPLKDYDEIFYRVKISYRGKNKWSICESGDCLNKKGKFEFESSPSERTEKFIKRTRFNSILEAYNFYLKWKNDLLSKFENLSINKETLS